MPSWFSDCRGVWAGTCGILCLLLLLSGCASLPDPLATPDREKSLTSVQQALDDGNLDVARSDLGRALARFPEDLALLRLQARLHQAEGDRAGQREVAEKILQLVPDDAAALLDLGLYWLAAGRYPAARDYLTRAVAQEPSLWRAWNALGILADSEQDHADAATRFIRALDIMPGHPDLIANLGWSRLLAGELQDAEVYLREAVAKAPESLATASNLAFCIALQGRYEEARAIYLPLYGEAAAANNVGYAALLRKDEPAARSYLGTAIRAMPTFYERAANNLRKLDAPPATP